MFSSVGEFQDPRRRRAPDRLRGGPGTPSGASAGVELRSGVPADRELHLGSRITGRTMQLHPAVAFAAARLGRPARPPGSAAWSAPSSRCRAWVFFRPRFPRTCGPCYRRRRLTLNQPDGRRGWTREPRVYGALRDVVTFDRRRRARRLRTRLLPQDGRFRGPSFVPKGVAHFRRCGLSAIHRSPPRCRPRRREPRCQSSDEGRRESKARRQRERVGSMGGNHG